MSGSGIIPGSSRLRGRSRPSASESSEAEMAAIWEGGEGEAAEHEGQCGRDRDFILFHTRERLQQGTGTVSWVSVWAAFYIWDWGGPAEVTLKRSSAMGGGQVPERGWKEKHSHGTVPEVCGTLRRPGWLGKSRGESEK